MRPHGEAEHRFGQFLGQRIAALGKPQLGIGLLQMRRDRIVDQRADAALFQGLYEVGARLVRTT